MPVRKQAAGREPELVGTAGGRNGGILAMNLCGQKVNCMPDTVCRPDLLPAFIH
jgi:hypothetical protein